ncbi:MAG: tagaturonate epimerase, partial [Lentisphaeria bacterium]|nr:tagaturonate epimerase [Lentisphaeria bacterium]
MKNILEKSIVQQLPDIKGKVIYFPASVRKTEFFTICSAQDDESRFLVLATTMQNNAFDAFEGEVSSDGETVVKKAPLSAENAVQLRKNFPWTAPVPVLRERCSFGCGDRLGCATSAHAELFKIYDAKPIFAQQSVRELTLTNRTFQSVVDDATFQVFQAGYEGGFGADGDHLKSFEHIKQALDAGVTMLTLDLSEQLKPEFADADEATVKAAYDALDA